jgi:hypothetical protein
MPGQTLVFSQPATRLSFGKVVFSPQRDGKSIFAHYSDFSDIKGSYFPVELEPRLVKEVRRFHPAAMSADMEKGPYADKDGVVEALIRHLSSNVSGEDELIVRLMSLMREERIFAFQRDFATANSLFTAGSVLAEKSRIFYDEDNRSAVTAFTHEMEPYLLATSMLRRAGISAYPALAMPGPPGDETGHEPVLAVIDTERPVVMKTFSLMGLHPPMCSLELLSDSAAVGLSHAMLAENRSKNMARDVFEYSRRGEVFDENDIESIVRDIATDLFACYSSWPESPFIGRGLDSIKNELEEKLVLAAHLSLGVGSRASSLMNLWAGYLASGLKARAESYLAELSRAASDMAN